MSKRAGKQVVDENSAPASKRRRLDHQQPNELKQDNENDNNNIQNNQINQINNIQNNNNQNNNIQNNNNQNNNNQNNNIQNNNNKNHNNQNDNNQNNNNQNNNITTTYICVSGTEKFRTKMIEQIDLVNQDDPTQFMEVVLLDEADGKTPDVILIDYKQDDQIDDSKNLIVTGKTTRYIEFSMCYAKACNIPVVLEEYLDICVNSKEWCSFNIFNITIDGKFISNGNGNNKCVYDLSTHNVFIEKRRGHDQYKAITLREMCRSLKATLVKF